MKRNHHIAGGAAIVLIGVGAFIGVNHSQSTAAEMAPPPPDVIVAAVEQKDLPVEREWVGTLDGLVNASIKAEVTGYLLRQDYTEGSFVRKGQLLFEIDSRPFQAAVDQAVGQLAQAHAQMAQAEAGLPQSESQLATAEANQRKAQLDEDRYIPLAQQQAVTQQDLDNARETNQAQKAQVAAAKSSDRDGQGADRSRARRCHRGTSRPRNGQGESRLHASGVSDRRDRGYRRDSGGQPRESHGERSHHGLDARSDQGEVHGQRAGISRPDAGRPASRAATSSGAGRWESPPGRGKVLLRRSPG